MQKLLEETKLRSSLFKDEESFNAYYEFLRKQKAVVYALCDFGVCTTVRATCGYLDESMLEHNDKSCESCCHYVVCKTVGRIDDSIHFFKNASEDCVCYNCV